MSAYLHKSFILTIISLIRRLLQLGRIRKSKLVLPLTKLCSSHNPSFKCSYFHDLDKFGKLCSCLVPYEVIRFTKIWVWWVGLWIKFGKTWYHTRVQVLFKVIVWSFELGCIHVICVCLFLLPFQQWSKILHLFFGWVPPRLPWIFLWV